MKLYTRAGAGKSVDQDNVEIAISLFLGQNKFGLLFSFQKQFPELKIVWEKYSALQEVLEYPAKTILLLEGKIARNYYFIEKGCLRVWFNNKEKDVTFQFFFENEGVASLESFLKNVPSIFTIETIEPTIVRVLSKALFDELFEELGEHQGFTKALTTILLSRQLHYMNEFLSRLRDTPQQRYIRLLQERPHIVKRIPQHYIASYLGITRVHLSRIKNQLAQSKAHRSI